MFGSAKGKAGVYSRNVLPASLAAFYTAEISLLHALTGTKPGDAVDMPAVTGVAAPPKKPKATSKAAKGGAGDEDDGEDEDSAKETDGPDAPVARAPSTGKRRAQTSGELADQPR